jgi:hypothetical protein
LKKKYIKIKNTLWHFKNQKKKNTLWHLMLKCCESRVAVRMPRGKKEK